MMESISRLPFPWWFLDVEQGTSKSTLQDTPSQARRVKDWTGDDCLPKKKWLRLKQRGSTLSGTSSEMVLVLVSLRMAAISAKKLDFE